MCPPPRGHILQPLNSFLVHSKKTQMMTEDAGNGFSDAKAALANTTLPVHPQSDAHLTFMTDASSTAIGASLKQPVGNVLQSLAFFSFLEQQTRYSVFSRELLAIYLAIRNFRHFLEGREFVVLTSHLCSL
uniref:Retrovirus-related Pol polyprotein from transposon 297 n=1 Tax=Schistocephalus solidus TaxID=70667 RepID=A0A0X3NTZ3_SCHSO